MRIENKAPFNYSEAGRLVMVKKILVGSDQKAFFEESLEELVDEGAELLITSSIEEFNALYEQQKPDLLLVCEEWGEKGIPDEALVVAKHEQKRALLKRCKALLGGGFFSQLPPM